MSVSMRESPIICPRQTITYSHRARVIFHMKSVSESEHVFLRRTSERMKNDVCEERERRALLHDGKTRGGLSRV